MRVDRPVAATRPDERNSFRRADALERFVGRLRDRADREGGPQSFRLPSGRVVVVKREARAGERPAREAGADKADAKREEKTEQRRAGEKGKHRAAAGSMATGEGAVPTKRGTPSAAGDAQSTETGLAPEAGGHAAAAHGAQIGAARGTVARRPGDAPVEHKILSEFETAVVARFEGGEAQAQPHPDGQPKFLQKTTHQWKEFFKAFLPRSVVKEVPMEQLAEAHTFRALLQKAGESGTGVLISDLALASGQIEKFTRIELPLAGIAQQLQQLPAGATVTTALLEKHVQADQLRYVAIRPRGGDEIGPTAQRDTGGLFTSQRTETLVAAQLGIRQPLPQTDTPAVGSGARAKHGRRGLLDGDALSDEFSRHVIPSWWEREQRRGPKRWFVPVTFGVLIAFLAIMAWMLARNL